MDKIANFKIIAEDKTVLATGHVPVLESEDAVWAGERETTVDVLAEGSMRHCVVEWPSAAIPTIVPIPEVELRLGNTITIQWHDPMITVDRAKS
jgi:hypothetical protein